jgi:hypothetical protein
MFVSAETVKQACKNDVNGMPKRAAAAGLVATPPFDVEADDPDDDDSSFVDEDDGPCDEERDDPTVEKLPQPPRPQPRKGQAYVNGVLCGAGTGRPLPYVPRPLPPVPDLPELVIPGSLMGGEPTVIPWTSLYKYLGFPLRSDLLDDHAFARVEKKTKDSAERLFPHHRLVRSWPLGLRVKLHCSTLAAAPIPCSQCSCECDAASVVHALHL